MSTRQHNSNRRDGRREGRPDANANANAHLIGSDVSVVQKQDQGTGRLTKGVVAEILTNSAFHPRGIKVRLSDGTVGRISDGSQSQQSRYDDEELDFGPPRASLADFMVVPLPTTTASFPPCNVEWPCPACTFVNSGLLGECELCQTARP